jgi:HD superfamily phosphodiesterase
MQIERVLPLAKRLLTIEVDESHHDLWLWEHAERVMHLTDSIARLPEVGGETADRTALAAAALFHDAGWIVEFEQGRWQRWQLLTRPTNEIQRELGAAMLQEEVEHLLPGATVRLATDAIRHCNDRHTELLEARILAEAEALDEIGVLYVLRQFRLYQGEGHPIEQLLNTWQRQREYQYWDVRLNDGFRYEATRTLARERLESMDAFMGGLRRALRGDDVRQLLNVDGVPLAGDAT